MDEGVLKLVLKPSEISNGVPVVSERIILQNLPW